MSMSDLIAEPAQPLDRDSFSNRLNDWIGSEGGVSEMKARSEEHAPASSDETLDAVGRNNEDIKNSCIDFIRKLDELTDVRGNFIEIFDRVGRILVEREQTKSALVERSMMLARAESAHQELKAEFRTLYEESEDCRAENSLLRTENERFMALVRAREARIDIVEAELREQAETAAALRDELEHERNQLSQLADEIQSAKAQMSKNDALITQLQVELATTSDQRAFAEQHAQTLQASLTESQQNAAKLQTSLAESQIYASGLADNIRELEIAVASGRHQIDELETLHAAKQTEHQNAQTRWQQETDQARDAIAGLESQIDELTDRSRAADRLLAEARGELQAKIDELRAEERRAQDLEAKLNHSYERQESDAAEVHELKQKLDKKESAHVHLTSRAQAVIRAMRDLKVHLEKADQRAQLASERLTAETRRFEAQTEGLQRTIRDLTEQLEKEKLSKAITEGALEAARQSRLQPV
jgi:chromosome segregation ATPase